MPDNPMSPPPSHAVTMSYRHPSELARVRRFVTARGAEVGMPPDRLGQLVTAVNELATNTLEHAPGPGTVRMWSEPMALVCQVDDAGHLADPRAGRETPPPDQLRGRGLLLVHKLSDLVQVDARPGHTAVRTYYYL